MKMPPYMLKLRFQNPQHAFSIWLPLFIIGPIILILLLAVLLIALPFIFLSFLFTWRTDWWRWLRKAPAILDILLSLPGLKIDVENGEKNITIDLY